VSVLGTVIGGLTIPRLLLGEREQSMTGDEKDEQRNKGN